ncbi:helix-turn-helix transcriptional regulator [Streptomyces hydrogenans]|uniref:helix-turn-helix transcriptional regulator n=1 Tax=Streptomyces hydrogenans TaxID=1873719 RepID=UPI00363C9D25
MEGATTMEFEYSFIVDGISVNDAEKLEILYENFDALLFSQSGREVLVVTGEGNDAVTAAHAVINSLKKELPQVSILRLDADLVGISDIANRINRTRQNVAQWVAGARSAPGSFPTPEGIVGKSQVWRWAEVNEWLEKRSLGDGVRRPSRDEALIIDMIVLQTLKAQQAGRPALEVVAEQDDRFDDRMQVMNVLREAIQHSSFMEGLQALPRRDVHRLKVVCAVLLDPLEKVLAQLAADELSGALAVISSEGQLHVTLIAATQLPGTVPIEKLGLTRQATVGDLVLLQRNGSIERDTPLSLAFD